MVSQTLISVSVWTVSPTMARVPIDHVKLPISTETRAAPSTRPHSRPSATAHLRRRGRLAFGAATRRRRAVRAPARQCAEGPHARRFHARHGAGRRLPPLPSRRADGTRPSRRTPVWPPFYAAFVLDPDGHNVEAVYHRVVTRQGTIGTPWSRSRIPSCRRLRAPCATSVPACLRATPRATECGDRAIDDIVLAAIRVGVPLRRRRARGDLTWPESQAVLAVQPQRASVRALGCMNGARAQPADAECV